MILKNFLYGEMEEDTNRLILYQFNSEQIRESKKNMKEQVDEMKIKEFKDKNKRNQSAKDLGLSSSINPIVSPSLYTKQVTLIKHFYKDFFLVLTKKTLLSIYDLRNKAVYYLFKIQESEAIPSIKVVGTEFFTVMIKNNSNDDQFFKILIFRFFEESMTIQLINRQTRLIQFIQGNLIVFKSCIYLITIKLNFFGIIIYKFPLNDWRQRKSIQEVDDLNDHNQMFLNKNVISLDKKFTSLLIIENYISNFKNIKIKCRKSSSILIDCILQSDNLDNLLVSLALVEKPPLVKSSFAKVNLFGNTMDTCPLKSNLDDLTPQGLVLDITRLSLINMFKMHKEEREIIFIKMLSLKLIKNEYSSGLVKSFSNYFYKKYLILVYQIDTILRIYFYYLDIPKMSEIMDEKTSQYKIDERLINFCAPNVHKLYKNLFYRIELKMKKSRFLYLRFGYDFENINRTQQNDKKDPDIFVQDIIQVIFDNRIENYIFSGNLKIILKKNILDFREFSLFAKNHNQVVYGKFL
jgi:hypothetical protein